MTTDPIAAARALIAAQPDLLFRCDLCPDECNCHPHHDMSMSGEYILCDQCEDFHNPKGVPDPLTLIATLADALEAERAKVAAAYEVAADAASCCLCCQDDIRALTPADAQAALDKLLAEARLEGWRAGREAAARCLEQGADEYSCGCDPIHCRCHHNIEQMRIDAEVVRDLPEPKDANHG